MPKKQNRLFVSIADGSFNFFFAPSLWDALIKHNDARVPTEAEVMHFIDANNIKTRSMSDVAAWFGVSKQTVLNWKRKAGIPKSEAYEKRDAVLAMIRESGSYTTELAKSVAEKLGLSFTTVERYCRSAGIGKDRLTSKRRPNDKELVALALNKTWPEFAAAAGLSLNYLRSYIYARPELARAVRVLMVRQAPKKKEAGNA